MMTMLNKIRKEYMFSHETYKKCRTAIKLGTQTTIDDYKSFFEDLPPDLWEEVGYQIFKKLLSEIYYFQDKPKGLYATIGPVLKPLVINKGDFICNYGDLADEGKFFQASK